MSHRAARQQRQQVSHAQHLVPSQLTEPAVARLADGPPPPRLRVVERHQHPVRGPAGIELGVLRARRQSAAVRGEAPSSGQLEATAVSRDRRGHAASRCHVSIIRRPWPPARTAG